MNDTIEIYKNFKYSIEDSRYKNITKNEFATTFKKEVLVYFSDEIESYQIINKFVKRTIRLYPQIISKISPLKEDNISRGLHSENKYFKQIGRASCRERV